MESQYNQRLVEMEQSHNREINRMNLKFAEQQVKIDQLEEALEKSKKAEAHTKRKLTEYRQLLDVKVMNHSKTEYMAKSPDSTMRIRPGNTYPMGNPNGHWIEKDGMVYCSWAGTTWQLHEITDNFGNCDTPDQFEVKNNWLIITPREN